LLDPARADGSVCQGGESPLACELRVHRPAVMFVFVGRNDVLTGTPPGQFRQQIDEIVRTIMGSGTIPVLATIPAPPDAEANVQPYNVAIADAADEFEIPVINLWRAIIEQAPGGVGGDLRLSPSNQPNVFSDEALANFGAQNRNLLALRTLERIRQAVPIP
jgi:hypothetical protein